MVSFPPAPGLLSSPCALDCPLLRPPRDVFIILQSGNYTLSVASGSGATYNTTHNPTTVHVYPGEPSPANSGIEVRASVLLRGQLQTASLPPCTPAVHLLPMLTTPNLQRAPNDSHVRPM